MKGEVIPVDGVITEGLAYVDESVITGEYMPRKVKPYNEVLAGGTVTKGFIKVMTVSPRSSSFISRMVKLVEEFKERKAQFELLIHKLSRVYLALMLSLACLTWLLAGVYKALVLVAVGCPSAFLVSIPATMLVALGIYTRRGGFGQGHLAHRGGV